MDTNKKWKQCTTGREGSWCTKHATHAVYITARWSDEKPRVDDVYIKCQNHAAKMIEAGQGMLGSDFIQIVVDRLDAK